MPDELTGREATAAAVDEVLAAHETQDTPTPTEVPPPEVAVSAQPEAEATEAPPETGPEARTEAEKARDEKGRFAKGQPTVTTKPPLAPKLDVPAKSKAPVLPQKPNASLPATEGLKPPAGWRPAVREKWGALPQEVQEEVIRREKEHIRDVQSGQEAGNGWKAFQDVVRPYEGMMRAQGAQNPLQAVASVLQTTAALQTLRGWPLAQLAANILRTHAVDPELLTAAYNGQEAPAGAQQGQPQGQYQDPRVDQLLAALQEQHSQRQATIQQKAVSTVEDFVSKNEFADDIRNDMADFLELAAKRGIAMTTEEAYKRALQLAPETSEVLRQREAAAAAKTAQASVQRAKAASSSVRGSYAVKPPSQNGELRGRAATAAAVDEVLDRYSAQ